jgi:geranylgeranyl pyrophosphate synthase
MAAVAGGPLQLLLGHALSTRGKLLRPALTIASGRLFRGPSIELGAEVPRPPGNLGAEVPRPPGGLLAMASAVECLHTASLIHDDIIDETLERRGSPSLHAAAGGGAAILAGDYLFAQAAATASETNNLRIMSLFARCVMTVCTGQIHEHAQDKRTRAHLSREGYYETIDAKTAALFVLACESGAVLGEASMAASVVLRQYGRDLGLAFQIIDDILDLTGDEATMGKPAGSDLRQGVMTLPVIYLREELPESTLLAAFSDDGERDQAIREITERARPSNAIQRARDEARGLALGAVELLCQLPANPYRDILEGLAAMVVEREL